VKTAAEWAQHISDTTYGHHRGLAPFIAQVQREAVEACIDAIEQPDTGTLKLDLRHRLARLLPKGDG
jgi:hypothetical protein